MIQRLFYAVFTFGCGLTLPVLGWSVGLVGMGMLTLSGSPHILRGYGIQESDAPAVCSSLLKWGLGVTALGMIVQWWQSRLVVKRDQQDYADQLAEANRAAEARIEDYRKAINDDWESKVEQSTDLDGAVSVIRSQLSICRNNQKKDPTVRVCIFEVDSDKQELSLATSIAGPAVSAAELQFFRRHSWAIGIAGQVARFKKVASASFDAKKLKNVPSLATYLVKYWGFAEPEVHQMCPDRRSWCVVPVVSRNDESRVRAVLYADSAVVDFFGKSDSVRQRILLDSAPGIAEKLDKRYDLPHPVEPLVVPQPPTSWTR